MTILEKLEIGDYEFVFVDDGSPDDSLRNAVKLCEEDSRVRVVELSRNFGHHKAMMTGLAHATGEDTFLIDIDLEEEPELLETFWNEMHKDENADIDVIYGVQDKRKGGWFERWCGSIFYGIFNWLSGDPIPNNLITSRLMSEAYKEALLEHKDKSVYLFGLATIAGFNQKPLVCHKKDKGETTYSIRRRIALTVDSITSFSAKPLLYIFYLGLGISMLSFIYICFLFVNKLVFSAPITGWTSLIISIYLLGGLSIASLGVIGIYIAKIFDEVKDRPYTIVKNIHGA